MNSIYKINTLAILLIFGLISHAGMSCQGAENPTLTPDSDKMKPAGSKITFKIGGQNFTATLAENATADAIIQMLPLTLEMEDLNRNEKFAKLTKPLPTEQFSPGTIQRGDVLLWGNQTVVIFYETFSSPYSYTRLGKIDQTTGLKETLGSGPVQVTFYKE